MLHASYLARYLRHSTPFHVLFGAILGILVFRPILLPWSQEPPRVQSAINVLACHESCLLLGLVVLLGAMHLLVVRVSEMIQILTRHELMIHPTLQVLPRQVAAFVMRVLGCLHAFQIIRHDRLAFRIVIQREDASLRRAHELFRGAEVHGRHGVGSVAVAVDWWSSSRTSWGVAVLIAQG